jgi:hypothetical protein
MSEAGRRSVYDDQVSHLAILPNGLGRQRHVALSWRDALLAQALLVFAQPVLIGLPFGKFAK